MSEPNPPKAGGLWARLFNVQESAEEPTHDASAAGDAQPGHAAGQKSAPAPTPHPEGMAPVIATESHGPAAPPLATPANGGMHPDGPTSHAENATPATSSAATTRPTEDQPADESAANAEAAEAIETAEAVEEDDADHAEWPAEAPPVSEGPLVETAPVAEAPQVCMACGTPKKSGLTYCDDCGWMFPETGAPLAGVAVSSSSSHESDMAASSQLPLKNRFEMGGVINERQGVRRHRGIDLTTGQTVVIVAAPLEEVALPVAEVTPVAALSDDEIIPGFDDEIPVASAVPVGPAWPSIAWEKALLEKANQPGLPRILDYFNDDTTEYLILEVPVGQSLWDAWDDPEADAAVRYTWLQKIAASMESLHRAGVLYEGIRPDVIVIDDASQPRITDITDVLPFPLPANAPIRATLYTAPELILSPQSSDARADLYSFGALIYTLEYLHHPLEQKDFERQYTPLQITERFPDVHPMFLRLINKTFTRDINMRFPTDEMTKTDPSGFQELIRTLDICRRSFDNVRLDISAWTTTGMIRTGNEDALTVLHGVDARLDDLHEYAMVLLCDGMGGYDAGEVAADMTINEMRKYLLQQPILAALTGKEGPKDPVDPKKYQEVLKDALRHANREVYTAARTPGKGKRGMGCTAECVYIDSRHVIAGHVGDSRVYHLHRGRLVQLTRDQTLVNRLVELGQLTAEEAENHPRKNELQQAIGGQPDVVPGIYHGKLQRGDWVLVCSDGLTNHISNTELEKMLTREAANSAEEAARRLLNLVNLRGATDNATIVVVRAS